MNRLAFVCIGLIAALGLIVSGCSASSSDTTPDDGVTLDGSAAGQTRMGPAKTDAGALADTGSPPPPVDASSGAVDSAAAVDSGPGLGPELDASAAADATPVRDASDPVDASRGADVNAPPGCTIPATPSFQKDVQPFLITSCGGAGCHVIDAASTVASGGYDHAYDWITGLAHASSCPKVTPTPFRFQVVIDVIDEAMPPSCSASRIMPPAGDPHPRLTACQVATLQAWLGEPMVLQTHRDDTISPTTPYLMPPFN